MHDHDEIVDPAPLLAQDESGRLIPRQDVDPEVQEEVEEMIEEGRTGPSVTPPIAGVVPDRPAPADDRRPA
jgi:hypothetical protein